MAWFILSSMAIRNLKIVESDLSGQEHASTVEFGVGGTWYEIDLTPEEESQLQAALKTYLKAGRKKVEQKQVKKVVPETTPEQRDAIREWAKGEGFEFAERGRIPKKILAAYEAKFGKLDEDF